MPSSGMCVSYNNEILVADSKNRRIRKMTRYSYNYSDELKHVLICIHKVR